MNVEQILSYVRQKGVVLIADGDQIKYKAPFGIMTPELAETRRTHRQEILGILNQDCECDSCPAAGYWDYMGPGKWCFHTAYFLGRAGKPTPCKTAQHDCPLKKVK